MKISSRQALGIVVLGTILTAGTVYGLNLFSHTVPSVMVTANISSACAGATLMPSISVIQYGTSGVFRLQ